MEAYVGNRNDDKSYKFNQIELLCNKDELKKLIETLSDFYNKLDVYKEQIINKEIFGLPHVHYRDNSNSWENDDADIVVYVNLSE